MNNITLEEGYAFIVLFIKVASKVLALVDMVIDKLATYSNITPAGIPPDSGCFGSPFQVVCNLMDGGCAFAYNIAGSPILAELLPRFLEAHLL